MEPAAIAKRIGILHPGLSWHFLLPTVQGVSSDQHRTHPASAGCTCACFPGCRDRVCHVFIIMKFPTRALNSFACFNCGQCPQRRKTSNREFCKMEFSRRLLSIGTVRTSRPCTSNAGTLTDAGLASISDNCAAGPNLARSLTSCPPERPATNAVAVS